MFFLKLNIILFWFWTCKQSVQNLWQECLFFFSLDVKSEEDNSESSAISKSQVKTAIEISQEENTKTEKSEVGTLVKTEKTKTSEEIDIENKEEIKTESKEI